MLPKPMNHPISLFKWIWKSYLRTALIPLVLVELVFLAIYFFTNSWSQRIIVGFIKNEVQGRLQQIADREATVIQQQLLSVSYATEMYRRQNRTALSSTFVLDDDDADRIECQPNGPCYTTRDRRDGGAAIFFSGFLPIGEKEREKMARVISTQQVMKNMQQSLPLAASIYLNTFDSLNIIYPYFNVVEQYPAFMNIATFNFYYEANLEHNPERKVKWTDVYLDPAGHGWMVSAIAPVYNLDFLEGVVGIDVTVSTIVNSILNMDIPYSGYGILVGKDGKILALPEAGETDWGLDELTDHHYSEAIQKDTFKPDQFNLKKKEGFDDFAKEVFEKKNGLSTIVLNDKKQVVSWSTIPETDWKLAIIVTEESIFADVNQMSRRLLFIGTLMIAGLFIFYFFFFFILSKKARKMSFAIAKPLGAIKTIAQKIGEGQYQQTSPELFVHELQDTADYLVKMGQQLGLANDNLILIQEKLKKSEADLRALVKSLDDVIIEVDENGFFVNIWAKDSGNIAKKYQEGVGSSIDTLFERITAERYKETIHKVIESGKSESIEYELETNNGVKWFQARISLVDKNTKSVVISSRDITERIAMEKKMIAAKEEAENANKAKSKFLSSMSHELRTPLNAVLGFAQLLEIDSETTLNDVQLQSVKQILKAGNHLLALIDEVLDLSKIESGQLSLSIEPVQIESMMRETQALVKPLGEKYLVKITYQANDCSKLFVMADRTRIKQVLLNLLSNGIKYNRRNGEVKFSCERIDNHIRFHVNDNGYGIAETEIDNIFKPFHRIGGLNNTVEGSGIGLTVAKQLVESMHGQIYVESQEGIGSHFFIEMPIAEISRHDTDPKEEIASTLHEDKNHPARKLLYIEDNPDNLYLVECIIGQIPHLLMVSAASGEKCLELAFLHKPDLILLDINLPGLDGFEVLKRLQDHDMTRKIPVLAVSANAMPQDIENGLAAGFVDYITKPINVAEFLNKIRGILSSKKDA